MKKHLFLTGEIQIGKSTLLKALVNQIDGTIKGFQTVSFPGEGTESDVYILPPGAGAEACRPENRIIHREYLGQPGPAVFPEAFRGCGCALLENVEDADFLLMDEIGIMEAKSPEFQEAVRKCVNGDIPILGVVRKKPHPFLNWVREHPLVEVVEITTENRDTILPELQNFLRNARNENSPAKK